MAQSTSTGDASHQLGFRFEHTIELSEAEYTRLREPDAPPLRRIPRTSIVLAMLGLAAVAGPRWLAPLGGILLAIATLLWFVPRATRRGLRDEYTSSAHLHGPVTYGASDEGFWIHGGSLRAESTWAGLRVWRRQGEWLLLHGWQMPPVYLPMRALEAAGASERVLDLARRHAVEYDSSEARAARRAPAG